MPRAANTKVFFAKEPVYSNGSKNLWVLTPDLSKDPDNDEEDDSADLDVILETVAVSLNAKTIMTSNGDHFVLNVLKKPPIRLDDAKMTALVDQITSTA